MSRTTDTPALDAHRHHLVSEYARHVIALAPESVLDVGCGDGLMMDMLGGSGISAKGVDPSPRQLERARARGVDVAEGHASELAFADGEFDWVVIRHVLHHLDEPEIAVAEAWRVARTGVALAEPTTDPSIESQREMARFDELTTELLGRVGHIHHPYLSAGRLIELFPTPPAGVDTRSYGRQTFVPEAEARVMTKNAAHERELTGSDLERLEEIATKARENRITFNGTVAVFARK